MLIIKKFLIGVSLLMLLSLESRATTVTDFNDVIFWAGSGTNEAVLVIDWHDSNAPESLAWGFRWNGSATAYDMITAVVAADTALLYVSHANYPMNSLFALGYDLNHNQSTFTVGTPVDLGGSEDGFASDSADHYHEGWFNNGFWGLSYGVGNPYSGGSWTDSWVGIGDFALTNGDWVGIGWSSDLTNFLSDPPSIPTAVPESGTVVLFIAGVLFLFSVSRKWLIKNSCVR